MDGTILNDVCAPAKAATRLARQATDEIDDRDIAPVMRRTWLKSETVTRGGRLLYSSQAFIQARHGAAVNSIADAIGASMRT